MRSRLAPFICALVLTGPAYAHGEELLVSVYSQVAVSVAIAAVLFLTPALRKHIKAGLVGILLGIVVAWFATGNMPFMENRSVITLVDVAFPLAFAVLAVGASKYHVSK